jgi:DNA-binding winged helix-turn-helix (wHTH) protein
MNNNSNESEPDRCQSFCGRKLEFEELKRAFQRTEPLSIAIVGLRGMGKTSLLRYIQCCQNPLRDLLKRKVIVMVEIGYLGYNTTETDIKTQFWKSLGSQLPNDMNENSERNDKGRLSDALENLTRAQNREVLFLLDDFDMIFDNLEKENWREVVQTLIGWVRMKGVSTIITTQRDLSQLVKHLSKKESANDSSTEFWNLLSPLCLDTLYLKPMPRDEMDAFKKIMEQDYQTQLDKPDVDEMYKLTGGHPELTQEAFSKLLERKCLHPDLSGQLVKSKKARRLTYDIVARQLQSGTQRLFLRYWNWDDLTEVHKQLLFTLATGRNLSLDEQSRIETSDLFNWGLITVAPDNDRYEIFSEAFKAFVNQRRREAFSDDPEKLYLTLELRLSKRQLQLFRLLYQNAGEELSEPELRKQIWEGKSLAENSRAVDLAIRRLKEKMKEVDPDQILGRIERLGGGSGYRFHKNNSGELPTP